MEQAMKQFDLSGKVAVVTGGNGGIGLGMARGLAGAGATIVVAGRQEAKNDAAVKELAKLGAKAIAIRVDVRSDTSCRTLMRDTVDRFGRLDILVNNAGTNIRKQPQDYTMDEWQLVLETNLTSAFVCSQAAYPHMVRAGGGKIINIGSMMSIFGASFTAPYAASKGGIVQMSRAMACAWAKDNIQVNSVLPGWIDTDLTRRARQDVAGLHDRVLARTPAGRWGVPDDFGGIAVFLASAASSFLTGTAIPVDGGYSVQG
jgi:2-deoxy-D-gluconate 3-dehydrogenase